MGDFDDLPLIRLKPQPVPVGHPEHPAFHGYEDIPDEPFYSRGYDSVHGWKMEAEE